MASSCCNMLSVESRTRTPSLNNARDYPIAKTNFHGNALDSVTEDLRLHELQDLEEEWRSPSSFQHNNVEHPPLSWTLIWRDYYGDLGSDPTKDDCRFWGRMIWGTARLERIGTTEILLREQEERWGMKNGILWIMRGTSTSKKGHGDSSLGAFCKTCLVFGQCYLIEFLFYPPIKAHTENASTLYQSYFSLVMMIVLPSRRLGFGNMVLFLEL